MALLFDRRKELSGKPGSHAFVVGISRYPHLPASTSEVRPKETFELRGLTIAARSAYDFYSWLKQHADDLGAPLKTIRLLIAPSEDEMNDKVETEVENACSACDFQSVADEIYEWQSDCRQSKEDMAIFYFCGNGVELNPSEPAIVLSDFGQVGRPRLWGVVSVNNLVQGMSPSQAFESMARTQLFLFDAGRRPVKNFMKVVSSATNLFDLPRSRLDDRDLAVCHAAASGTKAFAKSGRNSYFLSGVIDCLNGLGAIQDLTPRKEICWIVTIDSLARALPKRVSELSDKKQTVSINTIMGKATIVRLNKPPEVPVTIKFQPTESSTGASIEFFDATLTPMPIEIRNVADRFESNLPIGLYQVRVKFPTTNPAESSVSQEITLIASVKGPSTEIIIQKPVDYA